MNSQSTADEEGAHKKATEKYSQKKSQKKGTDSLFIHGPISTAIFIFILIYFISYIFSMLPPPSLPPHPTSCPPCHPPPPLSFLGDGFHSSVVWISCDLFIDVLEEPLAWQRQRHGSSPFSRRPRPPAVDFFSSFSGRQPPWRWVAIVYFPFSSSPLLLLLLLLPFLPLPFCFVISCTGAVRVAFLFPYNRRLEILIQSLKEAETEMGVVGWWDGGFQSTTSL